MINLGRSKRIEHILKRLADLYPDAKCELEHRNAFELLIATILSAQTTDKQVNIVTKPLFASFPDAYALANATEAEVAELIKGLGLFKNKSKNIVATARRLVEKFGGEVPDNMEALLTLPGVGRKTANVVLSNAFGIPAIAVDTHVFRVSQKLGLAKGTTPEQVEVGLRQSIPRDSWSQAHHWLIFHGRRCCHARKPNREQCGLAEFCSDGRKRTEQ